MARLLYVEASPRKERSVSTGVAKAFVEEYRKTHPGDEPIVVEPILGKPESVERTKAEAAARARSAAGAF